MSKTVVAAILAIAAISVALERPDVLGDIHSGPQVVRRTDRDRLRTKTDVTPAPVWTALEQMSAAERQNSCIQLELPGDASPQAQAKAAQVADLWNGGEYDEALTAIRGLGKLIDPAQIAIGNCWRIPVPTMQTSLWSEDVRIGNRDSIQLVSFDIHRASGNLFAVLLFDEGTGSKWAVNFSDDGGQTWSETHVWNATYPLRSLSASVLANHCYVAFGRGPAQD